MLIAAVATGLFMPERWLSSTAAPAAISASTGSAAHIHCVFPFLRSNSQIPAAASAHPAMTITAAGIRFSTVSSTVSSGRCLAPVAPPW